jgi:hypothetical protein
MIRSAATFRQIVLNLIAADGGHQSTVSNSISISIHDPTANRVANALAGFLSAAPS